MNIPPNVSIYTSTMDSMGYENYLNIFWKWLGTVGARDVQRCSLTFKHILLSLVQWWRPTQRNVHWENCSLQFIQTAILGPHTHAESWGHHLFLLNHHVFSFMVRGNPDTWPLMGLSQNVRSPNHCFLMKKTIKQLWMIFWVPYFFKKLPGSSSSFIISFAKLPYFRLNFSWRSRRHRYELQSAGHLTKKAVEPSIPSLQPPKSWNDRGVFKSSWRTHVVFIG
jgi:hypothetical protein